MTAPTPHYLLFSRTTVMEGTGRWQFEFRSEDGVKRFEAADEEPEIHGQRLELLTIVRALEALDQPSRVSLVGCSRYLREGLQYGLAEWRENDWQWEFFGQMVPVKNGDLWQRLDRTLMFHRVECRYRRFDQAHPPGRGRYAVEKQENTARFDDWGIREAAGRWLRYDMPRMRAAWWQRVTSIVRRWRRRVGRWWTEPAACQWTT